MLTLAQLITVIIVFTVVFIYNALRPADSHKVFGMVEGVLYSTGSSSVLVDGQIVREGEEVHGVRVTSISRNKVEFEYNGKRWEQRVREWPNPIWEETAPIQGYSDTVKR